MPKEIVGIQHLRGIAALAVIIDHSAAAVGSSKYFVESIPYANFLYHGARGVDLFFLISGFIITIVSLDKEWNPKSNIWEFASRRFARIVPIMWIAILSWAALRFLGRGVFDLQSFTRAMILSPVGLFDPLHIWTLRHEFIFYTVFSITFLGPKWARPLFLVWCFSPFWTSSWSAPELVHKVGYAVNVEFGMGVLVGLLWLKTRPRLYIPVQPYLLMVAAMAALMAFGLAMTLNFHEVSKTTLTALFCAPILLFGAYVECPPGKIQRLGLTLGNASYAIYLFHPHIVSSATSLWNRAAPSTPPVIVFFGVCMLAILGGVLCHFAIELPLLKRLRGLARQ